MHAYVKLLRGTSVEAVVLRRDNFSAKVELAVQNKNIRICQLIHNGSFFFRQLLPPSSKQYDTLCSSVIYLYVCWKLVPVIA